MNRIVGDRDRLTCITNKITTDSQYYCSGLMNAIYGGECEQKCSCGGSVTVTQYMNCCCAQCGTRKSEVFEYCCNNCSNYELSDRFTIYDRDNNNLFAYTLNQNF